MLKSLLCSLLSSLCLHAPPAQALGEFREYEQLASLIASLEADYVYGPGELEAIFDQVARDERVLNLIARPAERTRQWHEYRPLFVNTERLRKGATFSRQHAETLARAESTYGVPAWMITSIIGVETTYGGNKGRNRVIDALATLGFDYPPRAPFFYKELRAFLVLAKEEGLDPLNTWGSYAGAMGFPQFMPSSWQRLAVDFDGDGRRDLINNPVDAIGSVAHYFQQNGWQPGAVVALPAKKLKDDIDLDALTTRELRTVTTLGELEAAGIVSAEPSGFAATTPVSALRLQGTNGEELWLAFENFYVITRYNRSILYAMAVWQLAQELDAARRTTSSP